MPVIVEHSPNWADEFDMYGFQLYESNEEFQKDLEEWKECILKNYYKRNAKYFEKLQKEELEFNEWWSQQKEEFGLEDSEYWSHANKLYKEGKSYKEKPYNRAPDMEFSFGTNEAFHYSVKDIENLGKAGGWRDFSITEITQNTYDELRSKGFGSGGFWLIDRGDCYEEDWGDAEEDWEE